MGVDRRPPHEQARQSCRARLAVLPEGKLIDEMLEEADERERAGHVLGPCLLREAVRRLLDYRHGTGKE